MDDLGTSITILKLLSYSNLLVGSYDSWNDSIQNHEVMSLEYFLFSNNIEKQPAYSRSYEIINVQMGKGEPN